MPLSRSSVIAGTLMVAVAIPLLIAINFFEDRELEATRERLQADADRAASKLEMFLSDRLRTLRLLGRFLDPETLTQQRFLQAAADFNLALPGLKAINWISPDGTITWVYPRAGNEAALGKNVLDHAQAADSFRVAQRSHMVMLTQPIELFQGMWGVASYTPVIQQNPEKEVREVAGFLNGVFELESIVNDALEPDLMAHYEIVLRDGPIQIFPAVDPASDEAHAPEEELEMRELAVNKTVMVHDRPWKLTLSQSSSGWLQKHSAVFNAARLAGLLLVAAIAWAAYLAMARRQAQKTAQRDRERMQASLHQAQKLEAVGRLAGNVAHDFNNLMTSIVGNACLLETSTNLNQQQVARLNQIQLACDRATGLTAQMMASSNRGSVNAEDCELAAEFNLLLPLLRALVSGEISVRAQVDCKQVHVSWSPSQLAQVLTNLVSNAGDAYQDGGVVDLMISTEGLSNQVRLVVQDQGCGMSADVLDHAAEPFFTTKAAGRGTGLGLASVDRIVREAGGELKIQSSEGRGTTVTILLPTVVSRRMKATAPDVTNDRVESLRVLLVEDKAEVREVVGSLLQDLGHRPTAVASAQAALDQLGQDDAWDLLITDMKMPGMTGMELARIVREQKVTTPIILCSGYAENLEADELRSLGVVFLSKPFAAGQLARAIAAAC